MKNNRSRLTRFFIFPRTQLKYAGVYSLLLVCVFTVSIAGQFFFLNQGAEYGLDPAVLDMFKSSLLKYNLAILVVALVFNFLISILVTHRFLGPMIAIKRSLAQYKEQKEFKKIVIREDDEAHGLVKSLNEFFEEFNDKE